MTIDSAVQEAMMNVSKEDFLEEAGEILIGLRAPVSLAKMLHEVGKHMPDDNKSTQMLLAEKMSGSFVTTYSMMMTFMAITVERKIFNLEDFLPKDHTPEQLEELRLHMEVIAKFAAHLFKPKLSVVS